MNNSQITNQSSFPTTLTRDGWRRIFQLLFGIALFGALLFGAAGRLDWIEAWLYLGLYFFGLFLVILMVGKNAGALLNERGRKKPDAKSWDKVWYGFYLVFALSTYLVAGLDAGRFGWSVVPLWLKIVSTIILLGALLLAGAAMAANFFFSTHVRIQNDRGHQVATGGPYRVVRHPGYVGSILMSIFAPLMLGSWWALLPGGLTALSFIVRTVLEDRTLIAELPGYKEFTQQTRWRLLPGVW